MAEIALARVAKRTTRDLTRLREWQRKCEAGVEPRDAWFQIITDPQLGLLRYRGAKTLPIGLVDRTLANFLARTLPGYETQVREQGREIVARAVPRAAHTLTALVDHVDDPQKDAVRMRAAVHVLSALRVLPQPGGASQQVSVTVEQSRPAFDPRAVAEALENDPEALRLARELEDRIAARQARPVDSEVRPG